VAVGLVPGEMLNLRAHGLVEVAEVCAQAISSKVRRRPLREAMRLYERKGNTVSAARMTQPAWR
jgi:hypothetical protein